MKGKREETDVRSVATTARGSSPVIRLRGGGDGAAADRGDGDAGDPVPGAGLIGRDDAARLIDAASIAVIAEDRRELDESKIPSFVASINDHPHGITNPVTVTWDESLAAWRLIAGLHRLTAWRRSEKAHLPIPARVVEGDADTLFIIEFEENAVRVASTPLDQLKQGRKAEVIYKKRALERQRRHGGTAPGKQASTHQGEKGRAADLVAAGLDISRRTWEHLKAVGDAFEREPARYGKLAAILQEDGINAAWKKLKEMERQASPGVSKITVLEEDAHAATGAQETNTERIIALLSEQITPELHKAIEGKGHQVQASPSAVRAVCECGAQFSLPPRRNDLMRGVVEMGAHISAHWKAALASEGRT